MTAMTLCVLCVGSCFALYSVNATNVSVGISATYAASWSLDTNAYYLVFSSSNPDKWPITESSIKLDDVTTDGNAAQELNVFLQAGDQVKIARASNGDPENPTVYGFWSSATSDYTNDSERIIIYNTGYYNIYLNSGLHGYISRAS